MDSVGEGGAFVKREPRGEKGCVEEQPDEILDGLVALVLLSLVSELLDDGVLHVDLHGLLGNHVVGHGWVSQSLGFHNSLHIG